MSRFIKPCPQTGCRPSCLACPEAEESTFPQAFQTAEAFAQKIWKRKGVSKQAVESGDSVQSSKKSAYVPRSSLRPSPEARVRAGWRPVHASHLTYRRPHENKTLLLFQLKVRRANYLWQQPKARKE